MLNALLSNLKAIRRKELPVHLLFWIAVWFFFIYFFSYNSSDTAYIIWFSSALMPVTMGVAYIVVYLIIPQYLLARKYGQFALYTFYVLVASSYFVVIILYASLILILQYKVTNMPPMAKNFTSVMILVYLVVGMGSIIHLLNNNFKTISKNKELENKILSTQLQLKEQELHYLKRQIHPHFLFNTLNTIYGFALKQSKETPEIILKLSNLLDYILYQINKPSVSLREEIMHIKEYIELEKVRFQDTLEVKFASETIDESIQVAPMLLVPFIENAFKHGSIVNGTLCVEVEIGVKDKSQLDFKIRNSFLNQEREKEGEGIGLENIKKRLEIHYANNYRLRISNEEGWYLVHLIIFDLKRLTYATGH